MGSTVRITGQRTADVQDSCRMIADLLNEELLMNLAGERAFERGADYFADGHVTGLKEENSAIAARVRGKYYYRVEIWAGGEELRTQCGCPFRQDGGFFKA